VARRGARILVVDDDPAFCTLIRDFLAGSSDFSLIGTCASPAEALEAVPRLLPDIVLIDFRMPGMSGTECIQRLEATKSGVKSVKFLLVIGFLHDLTDEAKAVARRTSGCLTKPFTLQQLLAALELVSCGGVAWSMDVEQHLFPNAEPSPEFTWDPALSRRENEVALCLCRHEHEMDKEIADRLGVDVGTIGAHLRSIYKKLGVHTREEAVRELRKRIRPGSGA
jgi:DNA-binding NarL/FixJ family response regulator